MTTPTKGTKCSDPKLEGHCSGCTDLRNDPLGGTHAGCTKEHGHIGCEFSKSHTKAPQEGGKISDDPLRYSSAGFGEIRTDGTAPTPQEEARGVREIEEKIDNLWSDYCKEFKNDMANTTSVFLKSLQKLIEAEIRRARDEGYIAGQKRSIELNTEPRKWEVELARTALLDELEKEIEGMNKKEVWGRDDTDGKNAGYHLALSDLKTLLTKLRGSDKDVV